MVGQRWVGLVQKPGLPARTPKPASALPEARVTALPGCRPSPAALLCQKSAAARSTSPARLRAQVSPLAKPWSLPEGPASCPESKAPQAETPRYLPVGQAALLGREDPGGREQLAPVSEGPPPPSPVLVRRTGDPGTVAPLVGTGERG